MTSPSVSRRSSATISSVTGYSPLNSPNSLRRHVQLSRLRRVLHLLPQTRVSPQVAPSDECSTGEPVGDIRSTAPNSPRVNQCSANRRRIQDLFATETIAQERCYSASAPGSPLSNCSPVLRTRRRYQQRPQYHQQNSGDGSHNYMYSQSLDCRDLNYPPPPVSTHLSISSSPRPSVSSSVASAAYQAPPPPYPGAGGVDLIRASQASCSTLSDAGSLLNGHREGHSGSGTPDGYLIQPSMASAAPFQEIREISLGRHEEEPYGMRIEAIGVGFYITHIVRHSQASFAGLKVGDELVRVNDHSLVGQSLQEVLRFIRETELCVSLAFKPRAVVARIREVQLQKKNGVLGLRIKRRSDGLYIDFVKSDTPASEAGLKEGDQVLKIDSDIVTNWSHEEAMAMLKSIPGDRALVLCVRETLPLAHVGPCVPPSSVTPSSGASIDSNPPPPPLPPPPDCSIEEKYPPPEDNSLSLSRNAC